MRLAVISFTRCGSAACGRLVGRFRELGAECEGYVQEKYLEGLAGQPGIFPVKEPVGAWTGRMFDRVDGLVYIGAAGIAVRAIAPYLKDKMTDPAVVAVDELGTYAVSLLSGHVGGANRLAKAVAGILGAKPVITTASDVHGLEAVDVWAADRKLRLSDREMAKRAASALVGGEAVGFFSDYPFNGPAPEGYMAGRACRVNVWITCRLRPGAGGGTAGDMPGAGGETAGYRPESDGGTAGYRPESDGGTAGYRPKSDGGTAGYRPGVSGSITGNPPEGADILRLIPASLTVGIGCRKGVVPGRVETAVRQVFQENNLDIRAVSRVASIDIKRDEAGICEMARILQVPFVTYPAEELETVKGAVSESAFVRQVTGTGGVCERASLLGAGSGAKLLVPKTVCGGVTVAVAETAMTISLCGTG